VSVDSEAVKESVRTYILQRFLPGEEAGNLRDDTALRSSGILDSLTTLELVTFVEEQFGISVEPREASSEFDRIEDIARLVERKR
jgi:acyl carrier protein